MTTFKATIAIFILIISVLALSMMSAANGARIRRRGSHPTKKNHIKASTSTASDSQSFLFARNTEHIQNVLMQVDVNTGSFIKLKNGLPNGVALTLDVDTRTVYTRDNHYIYSISADSLELIKTVPIVGKHPIVDLKYDNGLKKLIGIIGISGGDQYGIVEIDTENGNQNVLLEFEGRFHSTAYDDVNHMYYMTRVDDGSISQFNMTHHKMQRSYPLPTRVTGMAVDGRSHTVYACAQHGNSLNFAKLDLKTGKLNEVKSVLPGVVESVGAFDPERGIYYGSTRVNDIMHQLMEINVQNGEVITKTLPASFYDAVFVPPKKMK